MSQKKALVIFSGGQDSTTCLVWAIDQFGKENVSAISFFYGQKHSVELNQSKTICSKLGIEQKIVFIDFLSDLVKSALTSNGDVNQLNDKGLPSSFVPNRNQLFITLSHSYAQSIGADALVTGVCQTDFSGYPDCREPFIVGLQNVTNLGSQSSIHIYTPLMNLTKAETFRLANDLGYLDLIIEDTHTCYNGDRTTLHPWGYGCGQCPSCNLREKGWNEFLQSSKSTSLSSK